MKKCPVCAAVTFDDAEVCYGCRYCFGAGGTASDVFGNDSFDGAGGGALMDAASSDARARADVEVLDDDKTIILHLDKTVRIGR